MPWNGVRHLRDVLHCIYVRFRTIRTVRRERLIMYGDQDAAGKILQALDLDKDY